MVNAIKQKHPDWNTSSRPLCAIHGIPREWEGPLEVLEALGPICPQCNAENLA